MNIADLIKVRNGDNGSLIVTDHIISWKKQIVRDQPVNGECNSWFAAKNNGLSPCRK